MFRLNWNFRFTLTKLGTHLMDTKTIKIYDELAQEFHRRHSQSVPIHLYRLAEVFFRPGKETLDLGSGIGRDTEWLNLHGFPAVGMDPSEGMLQEARIRHPGITFHQDSLPGLNKVDSGSVHNLFVCAVLMHIPKTGIITSVHNMLRVMAKKGRIILSWRHGTGDSYGRLFETYQPAEIARLFESLGGKVLYSEKDREWFNLVIEKTDRSISEGLSTIQEIINREQKTSTYKLALLRALCEISRYEEHIATWDPSSDSILIPLKRIAARWATYYLPLLREGIRQTTKGDLIFKDFLVKLPYTESDLSLLSRDLESGADPQLEKALKRISQTIREQPARYAGPEDYSIFGKILPRDAKMLSSSRDTEFGILKVPGDLWRDLCSFSFWIEDSLILQWAQLTSRLNRDGKFVHYFDLISRSTREDDRSTRLIRKILEKNRKDSGLTCVWTGRMIKNLEIDHMIPWSLWRNNSIWNLLPAEGTVNSKKSDLLPSPDLIRKSFDRIQSYWNDYDQSLPDLFSTQLERNLGITKQEAFGARGLEALELTVFRIQRSQGTGFWQSY